MVYVYALYNFGICAVLDQAEASSETIPVHVF